MVFSIDGESSILTHGEPAGFLVTSDSTELAAVSRALSVIIKHLSKPQASPVSDTVSPASPTHYDNSPSHHINLSPTRDSTGYIIPAKQGTQKDYQKKGRVKKLPLAPL
jgi:hypothetical protein